VQQVLQLHLYVRSALHDFVTVFSLDEQGDGEVKRREEVRKKVVKPTSTL
jgi:hypothetical protein